jgi:hypothetical protein
MARATSAVSEDIPILSEMAKRRLNVDWISKQDQEERERALAERERALAPRREARRKEEEMLQKEEREHAIEYGCRFEYLQAMSGTSPHPVSIRPFCFHSQAVLLCSLGSMLTKASSENWQAID